jgi:hypothetical protein
MRAEITRDRYFCEQKFCAGRFRRELSAQFCSPELSSFGRPPCHPLETNLSTSR